MLTTTDLTTTLVNLATKTEKYERGRQNDDWFVCRYGSDAGRFTEHVVHTAGGAAAATYNISNLGMSVMAKKAAADAVIAMASSSSAAQADSGTTTDACMANTQQDSNVTPAYSVSAPIDDVSPASDAVANVSPAK